VQLSLIRHDLVLHCNQLK